MANKKLAQSIFLQKRKIFKTAKPRNYRLARMILTYLICPQYNKMYFHHYKMSFNQLRKQYHLKRDLTTSNLLALLIISLKFLSLKVIQSNQLVGRVFGHRGGFLLNINQMQATQAHKHIISN